MPSKRQFDRLKSWSYSVYTQYLQCPYSICLEKIQWVRIAEPPSPILDRGDIAHKIGQSYVTGKGNIEQATKAAIALRAAELQAPVPANIVEEIKTVMTRQLPLLDSLRKAKATSEVRLTFTKDYEVTDWRAPNAWLRMIMDALTVAKNLITVTDYKTGKVKEEHKQQRSLYGLGALQLVQLGKLPGDKKTVVRAEHVYLDWNDKPAFSEYKLEDLPKLKREWAQRIDVMMSDTTYPTRPGYHCNWCKYRKSAGGPCPENK